MEQKKLNTNFIAIIVLIISLVCVAIGWVSEIESGDGVVLAIISATISLLDIRYIICKEFYAAAVQKGYEGKKYFWYGFFFGLVGYLLVIALPDKKK